MFQIFIQVFFPLDLADKHILSQKPVYIFLQPAGRRINRTQTILRLIRTGLPLNMMLPDITHQMLKGDIILDHPLILRLFHLELLGDTGTDKCKFILYPHLFPRINRRAHHRTLHRKKLRNQLRRIALYVSDHSRTGLRNASCKMIVMNIIQITPRRDICPERYTQNATDTRFFQPAQHRFVFLRVIRLKCRSHEQRYTFSAP